jgi:hypothetical protein
MYECNNEKIQNALSYEFEVYEMLKSNKQKSMT